jgi:hypothetical protein
MGRIERSKFGGGLDQPGTVIDLDNFDGWSLETSRT